MKNNGLPTKKEWDKIVDDAFSSAEIHEFSDMYERRKADMQKGIFMDSKERKRIKDTPEKKIKWSAVVGIAAAVALVPVSLFTVNHLSGNKAPLTGIEESQLEETSESAEETETTETEPENKQATEELSLSDNIYAMIVSTEDNRDFVRVNYPSDGDRINDMFTTEFTWLPDGLVCSYAPNIVGKYSNGYGGGMTPILYIVPESGINESVPFSGEAEQYETDDRIIMIDYRTEYVENAPHDEEYVTDKPAHLYFGREVWVAFKGTKYVQMFYITDDFSKDEVRKIAENIQLVPAEEETATVWFDRDEDVMEESNEVDIAVHPSLGICAINVDDTVSEYLGVSKGVFVKDVLKDSAAEKAGITVGDIIISIEDEEVATVYELNEVKQRYNIGDTVKMVIDRKGEKMTVNVQLQDTGYPDEESSEYLFGSEIINTDE